MSFEQLNLNSTLLRAIAACGFDAPTDIQREAIPVILAGRDLMASAQTGTGKTAAFVLPALQRLQQAAAAPGRGPRVLVLTPTRELAMQVNENIRQFGRFCRIQTGTVVGGMPYPPQMRMLKAPLDLLVATPGRLLDHMSQNRVDFSRLEFLVLDEADRMLDLGFVDAVREIAAATPATRQTLLFSATLEGRVLGIAKELLKDPARIQLAANAQQHADIEQRIHQADNIGHKHRLLTHYVTGTDLSQAVIFTATKRGADDLARKLADDGHASVALHGDMGQGARRRTVEQMRRGRYRLLVATDVAARGLDIKGLSHVINFDLPMVAEDYIHRIGRTGRGGASGVAVSLVGPDDWRKLGGIERLTGRRMDRHVIEGLEPTRSEPGRRPGNGNGNGKRGGNGFGKAGRGGKPGFSANGKPGARKAGYGKPSNGKPGYGNTGYGNPGQGKPGHSKPGLAKAADGRPGQERPAYAKPAARKPFKQGARAMGEGASGRTSHTTGYAGAARDGQRPARSHNAVASAARQAHPSMRQTGERNTARTPAKSNPATTKRAAAKGKRPHYRSQTPQF